MSLWTCIACSARRAVGLLECPHCGAADHEEGDTVSGAEGAAGQRHIPEAYADTAPAAPATVEVLQQAGYTAPQAAEAVAAPPAPTPAADTPPEAPEASS